MINILIRTANREKEFKSCIKSIRDQSYKKVRLIIATDSPETSLDYINRLTQGLDTTVIQVERDGIPFHWNLYCNVLKEEVTCGWFFYLDDDDFLYDRKSLHRINDHLTDPNTGVICQFKRGERSKPDYINMRERLIIKGNIGGSCIFLHHSQKNIADWDGNKAADYRFIKAVSEKIPLKFVKVVVVKAGNNGRKGK